MAGIGLYGIYYAKATLADGVVTGYGTVKDMGKAISASWEPAEVGGNPLYANNGIAERDAAAGGGGTLTLTLDRLKQAAAEDLFGLTAATTVISGVTGSGYDYTGNEISAPVGVGFIKWNQEDNNRNHYQALVYAYALFSPPSESFQTMGESVEWQTPEISGTVSGSTVTGSFAWRAMRDFPDQASAKAFIDAFFAAPPSP